MNRRRWGTVLIALGFALIFWGVIYFLEVGNGPGWGPTRFADRPGYDQVKVNLHSAMPGLVLRALAGWLILRAGWRIRNRD